MIRMAARMERRLFATHTLFLRFPHENGFVIGAQAFGEQGHLSLTRRGSNGVVKVALRGLRFALNFPDASIGQIIGLFAERSNESGAEPLDAIVGLSGKFPLSSAIKCAHLCPPSPASSASSWPYQSKVNRY